MCIPRLARKWISTFLMHCALFVSLTQTRTHTHKERERDTHARTSCFYYAVFSRNGKQSSVTSPPTYSLIPSILWGWMMITGKQTETAQKRTPLRQQQRPVHLTLNTASPARSGFNQAKAEHSNNRKSQSWENQAQLKPIEFFLTNFFICKVKGRSFHLNLNRKQVMSRVFFF